MITVEEFKAKFPGYRLHRPEVRRVPKPRQVPLSQCPQSSDRLGWSEFYAKEFNKTGRESAAHLAMWYLFLHLAHQDEGGDEADDACN